MTALAKVQSSLRLDHRLKPWEMIAWVLAFISPIVLPSHSLLISEITIIALFATSLDLILGYTGIVSLGHAAFFGVGAYAAALFAKLVMPDPLVGLCVAVLVATALGLLCTLTILRGSDLTRLMVTLGVGLIMLELGNKLDWLTGGADGLQGVVMAPVLGHFEFDLNGKTAAWYALSITAMLFFVMRRLIHSPFGTSLKFMRDNRLRTSAIGISVTKRLAVIYTVAAGAAGAAGGLLAQTTGFASLDLFGFDRSADLMLMLVIGGTGWLWGGITGAIVFKLMQSFIANITPQYWTFWIGLFLVVLVLVGRERIMHPKTWFAKTKRSAI